MSGFGSGGGNFPIAPAPDPRGQGGGNRDSYKLPNEGLSQAKYANDVEHEADDAAHGRQPALMERVKRWFSERF